MKIDNQKNLGAAEFSKKIRDRRQNLLNSFKNENTKLQKRHNIHKEHTRVSNENEILDLNDATDKELNQIILNNQKKLADHRDGLAKETQRLDKEKNILSNSHQKSITDLNMRFDDKYKEQYSDALKTSGEIFDKHGNEINKIENESKRQINQHRFKTKIKASNDVRANNRKISNQQEEFDLQASSSESLYRRDAELLKMDHIKKLSEQKHTNQSVRNEKEIVHSKELKILNDKHKQLLLQKTESFNKKYNILNDTHQEILDRLSTKFKGQAEGLVSKYSANKVNVNQKASDPFYRISKLTPELRDEKKRYSISIQVPEFESDKIRLTARDRKISLTLTRDYDDISQDKKGNRHSTKRSEVLRSNMTTKDILDGAKVTQEYKDGILKFYIAKK